LEAGFSKQATEKASALLFVLYAPRVFTGGGAVLLGETLAALLRRTDIETHLFLDRRFLAALPSLFPSIAEDIRQRAKPLRPGVLSYITAEWCLYRFLRCRPNANVLFFSSLGPLLLPRRLRSHCIVFVQNRFVIQSSLNFRFPWYRQLRLILERLLFSWSSKRAGGFVVQSDSMRRRLRETGHQQPVSLQPFIDRLPPVAQSSAWPDVDFVYVASADPHKNHDTLLKAWRNLAVEGLYPSLRLTVPQSEPLQIWKEATELNRLYGCKIVLAAPFSQKMTDRAQLYQGARALVYPSFVESHGLPLVEAKEVGLGVVAAELDYVRDAVVPDETFDPASAVSLARAIRRYLKKPEPPVAPQSGEEFVNGLISFYDSI
jgi:glycosyltransferase involved in cell wall biosynthesis